MTKSIICKDVFGNQYTVPVDELNIRVGVYAVIIKDNKMPEKSFTRQLLSSSTTLKRKLTSRFSCTSRTSKSITTT
ncbi:hypothetical protein GWK77_01580 [Candidatus Saccharibacteria bacterium oral taxon 488]|nr:hypothetical protein GWK77_01580 [Candidatus Saccharibacteria bacterium oral taxon 488]